MTQRAPLVVDRTQIIAYRRRAQGLDERLPMSEAALRRAAWAGLQDSMPRAALLSIHARVSDADPSAWEDPSLTQVWGPRYSAYVVAARDRGVFTLGRLPDALGPRRRAEQTAARLRDFLDGRSMDYGEAGHAMGLPPNSLRYATLTGTVLIRWDGARRPTIRAVPPPELAPHEARLELARRHLQVFGPSTAEAFAGWAGIRPPEARSAYVALRESTVRVRTPLGEAWLLADDEPALREASRGGDVAGGGTPSAPARLLPSGDTWFLLQGADRELLVPEPAQRQALWTTRVWPGALLLGGEIVGTWRRAVATMSIEPWRRLDPSERESVVAEAESLPLPGMEGRLVVRWAGS